MRLWNLSLMLCLLVALGGRVDAQTDIPNHKHWTVRQCQDYWKSGGRNLDVHVGLSDAGPFDVPTANQQDHRQFIIAANASASKAGDPPVNPIKVVIKPTLASPTARRPPLAGGSTELGHASAHWKSKTVELFYSRDGDEEKLIPYDSDFSEHHVLRYQVPFAGADEIYEGGSVGVVINGPVSQAQVLTLVAAIVISLGAGFGFGRWLTARSHTKS